MEKELLRDEGGQGAAEYILLFGGTIVIVMAALYIYMTYMSNPGQPNTIGNDTRTLRNGLGR